MKNNYFAIFTKLSAFILLGSVSSLGHAEIIVAEGNTPQTLDIKIDDSDLTVTQGDRFKVSYDRQLKGTQLSPEESERILNQIQVRYDEKSNQISVNMPKLWIGRASAKIHVVIPKSIRLTVHGEDGDIQLSKLELLDSSVNLTDGNVQIYGGSVTGNLSIKTEDGDIAIHGLPSSTTIRPVIRGSGKLRNFSDSPKAFTAASGTVNILTNDGNIEIF